MAPLGGGLAGYSGGTAQVFDLLPFYPLVMRGTPTLLARVYHLPRARLASTLRGNFIDGA